MSERNIFRGVCADTVYSSGLAIFVKRRIMKITEIWFSGDQIFGSDDKGQVYSQSLLWYPRLKAASPQECEKYTLGFDVIMRASTVTSPVVFRRTWPKTARDVRKWGARATSRFVWG